MGSERSSVVAHTARPFGVEVKEFVMLWRQCASARISYGLAILFAWFGLLASAVAQDEIRVVKVVEEWELQLNSPDSTTIAPQVTMTLAPVAHLNSLYATFELNHLATPQFAEGGLHFHCWNGSLCLGSRHSGRGIALNTTGEVIRWKQVLELSENELQMSIVDGDSTTWGAFGNGETLKFSVPTTLTSLNDYRPNFSVSQSGVGFGGGRVKRLAIVKLTAYTSQGYAAESTQLRIAHETK